MSESFVTIEDGVFHPQPKHFISTGLNDTNVYGGVLHAVATLASEEPPVFVNTMFHAQVKDTDPVEIDKQSTGGLHVIHLLQNGEVKTQSIVCTDTRPEPPLGEVKPIEMKEVRQTDHDWGWGGDGDLLAYMTGWFRKEIGYMWYRDHDHDLAAIASLADFSAIMLVPLVGHFGRTKMLTSHFTSRRPFERSYISHSIEGRTRGALITRLDQYDERGNPVCLSRMISKPLGLKEEWSAPSEVVEKTE